MITAVDSNVLVDVFREDPQYGAGSENALRRCIENGNIVACEVVWAELAGLFSSRKTMCNQMDLLGVGFSPIDRDAASLAGEMWRKYRSRGGPRQRVIRDFLIAAHAQTQCDQLLSRDTGFYRGYFTDLALLDPSS